MYGHNEMTAADGDYGPDVSVIIPTWNEEENIGRLLTSVRAQEGLSVEIIVVDQSSRDCTADIARSLSASVIEVERPPYYRPPAISRNIGARRARGRVLVHLDADMELSSPTMLAEALELISETSQAIVLHERDLPQGFWSRAKAIERDAYIGSPLESARMVTAALFNEIGGYNEKISSGEDFDIHHRYSCRTSIKIYEGADVLHHTGRLSLLPLIKKKYSYGKAAQSYLNESAALSPKKLAAIQFKALWQKRSSMSKYPGVYTAAWILRAAEGSALIVGLMISRFSAGEGIRPFKKKDPNTTRVLLLSPTTVYGSWGWFAELISGSPTDWEWTVVTYGRPEVTTATNVRFLGPRRGNYVRFGRFLYRHPRLLPLNVLWYVPLIPWLVWCRCVVKPRVAIANGILAAGAARIVMGDMPIVLAHHVYLGYISGKTRAIAGAAVRTANAILANSEGGAEDIKAIADEDVDNLSVVSMWASEEFFNVPLRVPTQDRPIVAFVGRCDPDKCAQAFRVCGKLAEQGRIQFIVVGTGELLNTLPLSPNIMRVGYVSDRTDLAEIMAGVDFVWAPADTTYLSRPAWEGLAAGARLIITDHPPADAKVEAGIRISQDVVPREYGIVVDGDDDAEALHYLSSIDVGQVAQRSLQVRVRSRDFAREKASPDMMMVAISVLQNLMPANSSRT